MSDEEVEAMMDRFERWDSKRARHDFISKMERKLNRKEQYNRS